jgi:succinate dehydrogenase/fumarate reductase-like Fe-S protein
MKAADIRKELESYGISTKAFLEKKELVAALEKARAEGKTPKKNVKSTTTSTDAVNGEPAPSSASRQEKMEKELNKAKSMKVGELKKALQDMGISTKSFFEKTEFVKAYAEAMVDGPPKTKAGTGGGAQQPKEEYDPSYQDVVMQKFDPRQLLSSPVIDIRLGR